MDHARARAAIIARSEGRLTPIESAALRSHLVDCDECRSAYDRATVIRRLAAGHETHSPLPTESRLLMAEVMGQLSVTPEARPAPPRRHWQWATGLAVAAIVLFVVAPWESLPVRTLAPPDRIQERGAVRALPGAGFGLSGVDGDGAEYEVVESNGICHQDALRLYVNRREESYRNYFIFGVDARGALHWYAPLPEELESYPLPDRLGTPVAVPYEILLEERHPLGPLVVVGLFSPIPLAWEAVSALLPRHIEALLESPEEGAEALAAAFGRGEVLPAVHETRIITCGGNQ